jgi:hypothetical protein
VFWLELLQRRAGDLVDKILRGAKAADLVVHESGLAI